MKKRIAWCAGGPEISGLHTAVSIPQTEVNTKIAFTLKKELASKWQKTAEMRQAKGLIGAIQLKQRMVEINRLNHSNQYFAH